MLASLDLDDATITIEYQLAPRMVVFSHGFGVTRAGRGLFTDIAKALPAGVGYVLFDYNEVDEASATVRATSFSDQVRRLQAVLDWTRQQTGVQQLDIIAHSMGCLVVAELSPENIGNMLLLAPPTNAAAGKRRERYANVAGVKFTNNAWHIPRRDGTTTIVPETFFTDLEQVDAEGELIKLALFRPYVLIIAEADDVLDDADYTELIVMADVTSLGIEAADHNFTGAARQKLVELINQQLR